MRSMVSLPPLPWQSLQERKTLNMPAASCPWKSWVSVYNPENISRHWFLWFLTFINLISLEVNQKSSLFSKNRCEKVIEDKCYEAYPVCHSHLSSKTLLKHLISREKKTQASYNITSSYKLLIHKKRHFGKPTLLKKVSLLNSLNNQLCPVRTFL